jgi:hypothetical protein
MDFTPISRSNALHRTPPSSRHSTIEDPTTARPVRTYPSQREPSERSSVGLTYTLNDYPENEFEPLDPMPNVNYNIRARQVQRPRVTNELGSPILPPTLPSPTLPSPTLPSPTLPSPTLPFHISAAIPSILTSAAIPPTITFNSTLDLLLQALQSISQPTFTSTDTSATITHQRIQQLESRARSLRTIFEKIHLSESRHWQKWQKNLQNFITIFRIPNILSDTYEEL